MSTIFVSKEKYKMTWQQIYNISYIVTIEIDNYQKKCELSFLE